MVAFSVALATCDGQDYLDQQLESLLRQSHLPTELVVCDDASQDGTLNILEKFARRAPFLVRVFRNASRLGYRKNFLKASSLCRGELIAFCDQDDIWDATKLERILKCFSEPGVLLAFHNSTLVTESGKPIRRIFGKHNKTVLPALTLNPGTVIPGHTIVIRRDLTRLDGFHSLSLDPYAPGERMPHDQWYPFWASVLGTVVYLPESLTHYRQHPGNTSGWPYPSLLSYALHHLQHAATYAAADALSARNRLMILSSAQESEPKFRESLSKATTYYNYLLERAERRANVHGAENALKRAHAFWRALLKVTYRKWPNGAGLGAFALDLLLGIPNVRPKRYGAWQNDSGLIAAPVPTSSRLRPE